MCKSPQENITYEFVPTPRVPRISCSWFVRWKSGGCITAVLWGVAFRICSRQQVTFLFPSSFFSMHFVRIHVVHPYSNIDTVAGWKKSHSILSDRSDFHMIDNFLIAVHTSTRHMLTSLSVDEMLLQENANLLILKAYQLEERWLLLI